MEKTKRNSTKKLSAVEKRIARQKKLVLEALEKIPIVTLAIKKAGISKATYYRWYNEDSEFAEQANKTKSEGTDNINDLAQSKLVERINEANLTAIIYWLKNKHPDFMDKKHIINEIKKADTSDLDPEDKERIDNIFNWIEARALQAEKDNEEILKYEDEELPHNDIDSDDIVFDD